MSPLPTVPISTSVPPISPPWLWATTLQVDDANDRIRATGQGAAQIIVKRTTLMGDHPGCSGLNIQAPAASDGTDGERPKPPR